MADTLDVALFKQVNPVNTSNTSLYVVPASTKGVVRTIVVTNTGSSAIKYRIFIDTAATTFDTTTALAYDSVVAANNFSQRDIYLGLPAAAEIQVRTDTANDVVFTLSGGEVVTT